MTRRTLWQMILWLFLLAGGVVGFVSLRQQRALSQKEAEAANWMPLSAKVISVSVRPVEHARPLRPHFFRRVNYGYAVDGIQYSSTRYSFGGDQLFRTRAQAEAAQPGAGQPIQIYFNPAIPSEAVVDPHGAPPLDDWRFRYGLPVLGILDGLLLLIAARFVRRLARRNRARPLGAGRPAKT